MRVFGRILLDPIPTPETGRMDPPPDQEKITLKSVLAKHNNDANAAMIELAPIMANMSKTLATVQAENTALKAKVPAEGAILIPKEKADLWNAVKDLAIDPKELTRIVAEFPVVSKELNSIKDKTRKESLAAIARVDGRKVDPEVFAEFFGDLDFVVKELKDRGDGKVRQILHVKTKDAAGKEVETEFGEHAKAIRPKLIRSLVVARSGSTRDEDEDEDEIEEDAEDTEEEIIETKRRSRRSVLPTYDHDDDGARVPLRGQARAVNQLLEQSGGRYGR